MTQITRENFAEAMRKAVEMRGGDYRYPPAMEGPYIMNKSDKYHDSIGRCFYSTEDGPACIIGVALHLINPALVPEPGFVAMGSELLEELGVEDYGLGVAVDDAQQVQDTGGTWAQALATFNLMLSRNGEYPESDDF